MNSDDVHAPEISIAGTGNVAWHLGQAFHRAGVTIREVYGRDGRAAAELAQEIGAEVVSGLSSVRPVDLMFICVSDDSITEVSQAIPADQFQAHTSGSVGLGALRSNRGAVFYPLQTFSRERTVAFSSIPLCLECKSTDDRDLLESLAGALGGPIHWLNSEERKEIHVAAVFASNFSNAMYHAAAEVLEASGMDLNLLHPLILETAQKATDMHPSIAQTGPAKRADKEVMNAHLERLVQQPELRHLYAQLSEFILNRQHGNQL